MADAQPQNPAADKNSPFEEVRDADVIRDVYNTCYKQGINATFWVKDKAVSFETTISGYNKERVYIDLPRNVDVAKWDAYFAQFPDPRIRSSSALC